MAPKAGNKNALKHGLYARKIDERLALTIEDRRAVLDACTRRAFALVMKADGADELTKLISAIAHSVTAANNCERTLAVMKGNYTPIEEVLHALSYIDPSED